ncbi:MAG: DNA polymerase III subunit gamma/tau [Oscillospiraceae bacterium]|nr:DNA polymerase III subunit gamma/tau [Oscillospiraceae bacterium]
MYQALYRKWRPRAFDDVIGQDHITETLKRQVSSGRLSHAYLFVGTRGTGKTTCAKILSRAVNCENPVDGNPCNKCPSCLGIESGAILDVVELDAASNNGVDNVRALRDEAVYSPASVKKRVYIVDEVHMLSTSAFNALLKILEEPPEHLMFILATTELHKVPATILSRCQRFSFKRILPTDIAKRMKYVASQEKIDLTDDGAELLSRLADGAMRDALSLLDQCGSEGRIDAQRVVAAIGLAGNEDTKKLFVAAKNGNIAAALSTVDTLYKNGKDMNAVVDELLSLTRDILIYMLSPENCGGLISGVFDTDTIKKLGKGLSPSQVMHWLEILKNTQVEMAEVSSGRIAVELCLLRMCDTNLSNDVSSLAARIGAIEKRLESGDFAAPVISVQETSIPKKREEEPPFYEEFEAPPWDEEPPPPAQEYYDAPPWDDEPTAPQPEPTKEAAPPPSKPEASEPAPAKTYAPPSSDSWDAILDGAQQDIDMPLFFMLNDKTEVRGVVSGDTLMVKCKNPFTVTIADTPDVIAALKKSAAKVLGRNVAVKLTDDDGEEEVAVDKLDALSRFDIISFE